MSEYSLRVQWKPPRDDGGVPIDNYTLSLYSDLSILSQTATTDFLELTLTLNYSTNYSITITASNCAGFSSLSFTIAEGKVNAFCANHPISFPSQLAVVLPLFQSMVVLWSTGVQRREQRSSSTVMMATILTRASHHIVSTQPGPLILMT